MFTGIVEERGRVRSMEGTRLVIGANAVVEDSNVDASVAVNGVCLTVVERSDDSLSFDVTGETLSRSSLGRLEAGDPVNLERPVSLATRLGGHMVQGHVDGVGVIAALEPNEAGATLTIEAPRDLMRYVVEKGSIAVDGVSLTVAQPRQSGFAVALIPHTLDVTTFGSASAGDTVNLEVDVIAKYVEGFLKRQNGENNE